MCCRNFQENKMFLKSHSLKILFNIIRKLSIFSNDREK